MTISKSYYGLLSVKSKQSLGMISVDELWVYPEPMTKQLQKGG